MHVFSYVVRSFGRYVRRPVYKCVFRYVVRQVGISLSVI